MPDFSSALYLGWRHPAASLGNWAALSLGKPAALASLPGSAQLAQQLADLQGCEAASLGSSTLHLLWDVFAVLPKLGPVAARRWMIFQDAANYPVLGWGIERAQAHGVPVQVFQPHGALQLAQQVQQAAQQGWRPLIVAEGYAPSLGRHAPLADYASLAAQHQGYLLIDDTQALGLFGAQCSANRPWGWGGGGSLQAQQVAGPQVLAVSSLAKAFGAPLAVMAGSQALIQHIEEHSQTRVHASPPNQAALRAAQLALANNVRYGDQRREHLWDLLQYWRRAVAALGLASHGGDFPVQTLAAHFACDWPAWHRALARQGTQAVLQQVPNQAGRAASTGRTNRSPRWQLSFIFNADHSLEQLELALQQIKHCLHQQTGRRNRILNFEEAI